LTGVAFLATLLTPWPAHGQRFCAPRADLLKAFAQQHQEKPVSMGLAATGGVIEVLASPDGATFTMIITLVNGWSCILANGEDWEQTIPKEAGHVS
jgi:hypothetical protein